MLLGNNKAASDMMEKMDKDNMVYNYLEWPLFKDFIKKHADFLILYEFLFVFLGNRGYRPYNLLWV